MERVTDQEAMKSYRERWKGEKKATEKKRLRDGMEKEQGNQGREIGTGWCLYLSSFDA